MTKGGYVGIIGHRVEKDSTKNKIFLFNSSIEVVGQAEIDIAGQPGYYFNKLKMDIAIGGKPVLLIASEGIQRNLYAFAYGDNKITMVDKIDDLHDSPIVDIKYFNGHYFTYGLDGIINRVSLSKE